MKDSQNYYTFLQNSLAQSATEQNFGNEIQSEIEQFQIGATQSQEMGTEILVSTAPAIFPTVLDTYNKVQKIYQNVKDIGTQFGKVNDAVKTLPSDIKNLYGSKVGQIEALIKDGGNENLAKAKSLYGDLQNTVQKAAQSGKSIATSSANKMVDLTESTIAKGKELASGLSEQGKSIFNDATNKISDITSGTEDLIKNTTVNGIEDVNKLRESLYNVRNNLKTVAQEQSAKIDAHIQNIKDTVPIEQQQELISKAENMKIDLSNQLKNKYTELKQNMINKSEANPEVYNKISSEIEQIKPIESLDSLFPMREGMGSAINELISKKPALGNLVSKNAEEVGAQTEQAFNNARLLATEHVNQIKETANNTATQVNELANKTSTQTSQLLTETATQAKNNLTEGVEESKNLISNTTNELSQTAKNATDLIAENANKLTSVAETVGKMGIEDLAEISGVSTIPVVGEIAGLAALGYGLYSGIKDLLGGGSSTPTPQQLPHAPVMAGIVHQAGL